MNPEQIGQIGETVSWVVIVVGLIVSAVIASFLETRRQSKTPSTMPYGWGYFFGLAEIMCVGLFTLLFAVCAIILFYHQQWYGFGGCAIVSAWCLIQGICGWFIIKRKRWAWTVGTIASLNLILWITNWIYARNRWKELS
jgi:hypothetical protein